MFALFFVLTACTTNPLGGSDCSLPGAKCPTEDTALDTAGETGGDDTAETDTDTDTDSDTDSDTDTDTDTDINDEIDCWYEVPFQVKNLEVDYTLAELTPGNWEKLDWVDIDPVFTLDGTFNHTIVDIFTECGSSDWQGEMSIPDDFVMTDPSDSLYNNGIVTGLQPDGSVLEVNYFEDCRDGTFAGWVLPDSSPSRACEVGFDSSRWMGAHGGSHATGTQAIRPGELTDSAPIGRPLPVEVDNNHLYCDPGETSGFNCFIGPIAASGDFDADNLYVGEIEALTMGAILVLPEHDCEGEMRTIPGIKLCQVARDHFFFVVDDSYGEDEVAFPLEASVRDEVDETFGFDLHNARGDFALDVEDMFLNIHVVTNPEEAVY